MIFYNKNWLWLNFNYTIDRIDSFMSTPLQKFNQSPYVIKNLGIS